MTLVDSSDQPNPPGTGKGIATEHQYGHRLWHKPWVSTGVLVAVWTSDINTDPGYSRTMNPDMVLGSNLGQVFTMVLGECADH